MEANVAYFLDDSFIRDFTFLVSESWVRKCCLDGYTFSLSENDCLESSRAESVSKFLLNGIRYGLLPPAPFEFEEITAAHITQFWENGTSCFRNSTKAVCFHRGQYCFDYVLEKNQFMLLNGTRLQEEFSWMELAWEGLKQFTFFFSLLLALVTLAVYLFLPALHRRVYDKCLICYLITVTMTLVTIYIFTIPTIMPKIEQMVYCTGEYLQIVSLKSFDTISHLNKA